MDIHVRAKRISISSGRQADEKCSLDLLRECNQKRRLRNTCLPVDHPDTDERILSDWDTEVVDKQWESSKQHKHYYAYCCPSPQFVPAE
jgi:hypothetical protein